MSYSTNLLNEVKEIPWNSNKLDFLSTEYTEISTTATIGYVFSLLVLPMVMLIAFKPFYFLFLWMSEYCGYYNNFICLISNNGFCLPAEKTMLIFLSLVFVFIWAIIAWLYDSTVNRRKEFIKELKGYVYENQNLKNVKLK